MKAIFPNGNGCHYKGYLLVESIHDNRSKFKAHGHKFLVDEEFAIFEAGVIIELVKVNDGTFLNERKQRFECSPTAFIQVAIHIYKGNW